MHITLKFKVTIKHSIMKVSFNLFFFKFQFIFKKKISLHHNKKRESKEAYLRFSDSSFIIIYTI